MLGIGSSFTAPRTCSAGSAGVASAVPGPPPPLGLNPGVPLGILSGAGELAGGPLLLFPITVIAAAICQTRRSCHRAQAATRNTALAPGTRTFPCSGALFGAVRQTSGSGRPRASDDASYPGPPSHLAKGASTPVCRRSDANMGVGTVVKSAEPQLFSW